MMHAGYWFLILLILNTLTALLYLIWYLVFKQDKDNRIQYPFTLPLPITISSPGESSALAGTIT